MTPEGWKGDVAEGTRWLIVERQLEQPAERRWLVLGWGVDERRVRDFAGRIRRGRQGQRLTGRRPQTVLVVPYPPAAEIFAYVPPRLPEGPDGLPAMPAQAVVRLPERSD